MRVTPAALARRLLPAEIVLASSPGSTGGGIEVTTAVVGLAPALRITQAHGPVTLTLGLSRPARGRFEDSGAQVIVG